MKREIYFIMLLCLATGCGYNNREKEAPSKKMIGINGEAVYIFNGEGSLAYTFKEIDFNNDYSIMLHKDTIKLGDDFKANINVPKSDYKITIESPKDTVFLKGNISGERDYLFTPSETGVFDFAGTIEFDSKIVPFDYKFIVARN